MINFKEWLKARESTPSTRNALGIYPPQADTIMSRPSYSQIRFCDKIKAPGVKLDNMNTDMVCGKRKNKK
jgi:hypothetical protein